MTKTNGNQPPLGYGHDAQGAAGGSTTSQGRVHVNVQAVDAGPDKDTDRGFKFSLDGRDVEAIPGETIFQVAARQGIELPHLCYAPKPGYRPDGNCRVCMVEIEGERVLAASCIRTPTAGMKVKTQTDRAKTARRMVVELLMADQPARETAHDPGVTLLGDCGRATRPGQPFPARAPAAAGPQPSGHGGQPRRLHPLQSVCARVP